MSVACAATPVPASTEVTGVVTLFFVPCPVTVTSTPRPHSAQVLAGAVMVTPERLIVDEPGTAVTVPDPHHTDRLLGFATTSPGGSGSVKPTPVNVVPGTRLEMWKKRRNVSFTFAVVAVVTPLKNSL